MIGTREEFSNTLKGTEKLGRWVLVRHYTKERSKFWKPESHEAVGGPAWKYNDNVVLCYSGPQSLSIRGSQGMNMSQIGYVLGDLEEYYFEHDIDINEDDDIYEFAGEVTSDTKPTAAYSSSDSGTMLGEKFKIRKLVNYRGYKGRIEFKMAICERSVTR